MKTTPIYLILAALLLPLHAGDLKPKKAKALIRLYEEEVLAHDLYVELGKIHKDIMPLRNIPRSEAVHQKVMAGILGAHGIDVPKAPKNRRFVTKGLDKLFDDWLAEGRKSPAAACRVGVRLEEHDIADLIAAQKQFPDSKVPLANLERASGNHLRAFHFNLTSRDGSYEPEVLSKKDFEAILAAPHGGPGRKGHGKGIGKAGCGGCAATENPADDTPTARPGKGKGRGRQHRGGR